MSTGLIPSEQFVSRMEQHWVGLGNVPSEPLRQTWGQLADAFNFNIATHASPQLSNRWVVVQPKTGTGKTQGAVVYCSMLSKLSPEEHPGAVMVTRLIEEADLIAQKINELSGQEVAFAYHTESKAKVSLSELNTWPILVITHRAYEMALDCLGQDGTVQKTWPFFHDWRDDRRKLVIIDECLDLVEHSQTDLDMIRQTLGVIPQLIRDQYPKEVKALQAMVNILEELNGQLEGQSTPETMVLQQMVSAGEPPDLTPLRQALREVRFDHQIGKNDLHENERLKKRHDGILRSLHSIFRSWLYYSRINAKHTLNTARLLVPENVKGAVVMDATASSNLIYRLFDHVMPYAPPEDARSYRNVTLHVSRGHRVGKNFMEDNSQKVCSEIITKLNTELAGRNVFMITHKRVEPILKVFDTTFTLNTGHWGKVDGSNEWRDCDCCVVFGLPYRPDTWTANTYMAYQGPQETEWLRSEGNRPFAGIKDIRQALKLGQIITETVQAINRVRCRKVIDHHGNCPPTDVYLMLPDQVTAGAILNGVKSQMPGVKVIDWHVTGQKAKTRKSNFEPGLICYLQNMQEGKQSKAQVQKALGMPGRTMDRLLVLAKQPDSELHKAMTDTGVHLEIKQEGKTRRVYFVKN